MGNKRILDSFLRLVIVKLMALAVPDHVTGGIKLAEIRVAAQGDLNADHPCHYFKTKQDGENSDQEIRNGEF